MQLNISCFINFDILCYWIINNCIIYFIYLAGRRIKFYYETISN